MTQAAVRTGTIITLGGGGFLMEPDNPLLDDFLLGRVPRRAAGRLPRVCFIPTASGDHPEVIEAFRQAYPPHRAEASVLTLFRIDIPDVRAHVLDQDLVFVGGGSTANLLAIWRLHGLDRILAEALASGVVCAGISAGMNCWFQGSITDSFGPDLRPIRDGLGFLMGSACPHYDGEERRRPALLDSIGSGALPAGFAVDDGAALVFEDGEFVEAVSSRPTARAFRVGLSADGDVTEQPLPVHYLG